jgi:hypothetical protein
MFDLLLLVAALLLKRGAHSTRQILKRNTFYVFF